MADKSLRALRSMRELEAAESSEAAMKIAVRAAALIGIPGIFHPGLDEAGMGAIWLAMVTTIARKQGVELSPKAAAKLVAAAVAGVSAYTLGSKILTYGLVLIVHAFPVGVIPVAVAMNVALNALFTYKLGKTCIERFANPALTAHEIVQIGTQIMMVPTWSEVREIRQLFKAA